MIDKTNPVGPGSPQQPEDSKKTTPSKKFSISDIDQKDQDKQTYKTWGGYKFTKDEWKKFMNTILKQVSDQIQQDMKRSMAALKRIKNVAEGKDPDA